MCEALKKCCCCFPCGGKNTGGDDDDAGVRLLEVVTETGPFDSIEAGLIAKDHAMFKSRIEKHISRTQKYIVFLADCVIVIARQNREAELRREVVYLKILAENGCSVVAVHSGPHKLQYSDDPYIYLYYIMEDISGLHSKSQTGSFMRKLWDMDEVKRAQARNCLLSIQKFSLYYSIGDFQVNLMDNGIVKVLDPNNMKEGPSDTIVKSVEVMIKHTLREGTRTANTVRDKGRYAD